MAMVAQFKCSERFINSKEFKLFKGLSAKRFRRNYNATSLISQSYAIKKRSKMPLIYPILMPFPSNLTPNPNTDKL